MVKNKFRSKSHQRKKIIKDFKKMIQNCINENQIDKAVEIIEKKQPLCKFLFPNIIIECIEKDNFEILREIIHSYLKQVDYDSPLLLLAIEKNDIKLTKLLLDQYFDSDIIHEKNEVNGLIIAIKNNNIDIVKLLLEHNINIDYKTTNGITAKMVAKHLKYDEIYDLLKNHKSVCGNNV